VILVDANLLLYATTECPEREIARSWLDDQLNGSRVGMPWPNLLAFLRLATNRPVYPRPIPLRDAWEQVESWLSWPNVWIPLPTERHSSILSRMLQAAGSGGNLVPDADLAAFCPVSRASMGKSDRSNRPMNGWVTNRPCRQPHATTAGPAVQKCDPDPVYCQMAYIGIALFLKLGKRTATEGFA